MTPARILRALAADRDPSPPIFTDNQRQRHERILTVSQYLLAREGRHNITFSSLAIALQIATGTLRFHFADLDALLGSILRSHLMKLSAAVGDIPGDASDLQQARRAAYLAYTRRPFGGLTEAHLLLVRDRHLLPPDELESVELMRMGLGQLLAGDLADEALLLLDANSLDAARIEARLAAPAPAASGAAPHPAPQAASRSGPAPVRPRPSLALLPPSPHPPDAGEPPAKPGDWIYTCGLPGVARAPPKRV